MTTERLFNDILNHYHLDHQNLANDEHLLCVDNLQLSLFRLPEASLVSSRAVQHEPFNPKEGKSVILLDQYKALAHFAARNFRTLWYNPDGAITPGEVLVHDGELISLDEFTCVPTLLEKPTLSTCERWLDEWVVPENIHRHSRLVGWMAYVLGVMLHRQGIGLDPILAHRGGLLHDIDKLHTLDQAQPHGEMGADFILEHGQPELAKIIAGHVMRASRSIQDEQFSWEAKLVFFCDKLAEGDRIVSFKIRLQALRERYPAFSGVMNQAEPKIWELNNEICSILSIPDHENLINVLRELQNY